jgi:hypothetical protein
VQDDLKGIVWYRMMREAIMQFYLVEEKFKEFLYHWAEVDNIVGVS